MRAEEDIARLADGAFSPVFLRNATAYGLSPRLRGDIVLNNFVGWAPRQGRSGSSATGRRGGPSCMSRTSRGRLPRAWWRREAIHNQAFNIGRQRENYQVRDIADVVKQAIPGASIEYANVNGPDPRNYRVDFGKAERELPEFKPQEDALTGPAAFCRRSGVSHRQRGVCRSGLHAAGADPQPEGIGRTRHGVAMDALIDTGESSRDGSGCGASRYRRCSASSRRRAGSRSGCASSGSTASCSTSSSGATSRSATSRPRSGAAWAIIQPFFTMVVFSLFFGRLAKMPSDGVPYPIFAYAALVPWTFFANGLTQSADSLVGSANLITKVYFPRLAMPIAAVLAGVVDFVARVRGAAGA